MRACHSGKESPCQHTICKRHKFDPWVGKMPWRKAWQPTPVFLPGEFHGLTRLVGYSPWVHRVGCNWVTFTSLQWSLRRTGCGTRYPWGWPWAFLWTNQEGSPLSEDLSPGLSPTYQDVARPKPASPATHQSHGCPLLSCNQMAADVFNLFALLSFLGVTKSDKLQEI